MLKKISAAFIILILFSASLLTGGEKQDLWLKAVSEKDGKARLLLLEEFAEKFKNDKRYFKNLHINLTKTAFYIRDFDKTIQYGEKTIAVENLEDNYKIEVYIYLANSYYVTKTDLDKAFQYAGLVVDLSQAIKKGFKDSSDLGTQIDQRYLVPALSIQASILHTTGKDKTENLIEALNKVTEAFIYDKSKRTTNKIFSYAIALYRKDPSKIDASLKAVENAYSNSKDPNPRHAYVIASWYNKKNDKENAIKFYKKSYNVNKKSKIATNIGILLNKKSPESAVKYFAEAYILGDSDKESKAYKYLRQLWYNKIAKGKTQKEQDDGFDEILTSAKSRLNVDTESPDENSVESSESSGTTTDN
ncbi:MAG: hypothetical protein ABFR75_04465 [Acidobacteriota bacterium]